MLADLCAELSRDCVADPPTLVFSTASDRPDRRKLGELVAEMLGDVGIVVELDERADIFAIVELEDCRGWEMSTWAWGTNAGFRRVADVFEIFAPLDGDQPNLYRWGTDAVPGGDKPGRSSCAEPEDPSSVRDEFTERYRELSDELRGTVDPDAIRSLVRELEDILVSQVAMIPLYVRPVAVAHRSDIIGGYGFRQRQGPPPDLWNVELWYRADRVEG